VGVALAGAGLVVLALYYLPGGGGYNVRAGVQLVVADIGEAKAVERVMSDFRPEVVDHHAAQVSVRFSVANPVDDARVNVLGSLNLLEACAAHAVKHFIFASTGGAIYGEQERFPASEDHPAAPLSPYGVAKLALEKYLLFYEKTHGISWTALRYANVYGPRQDPFGEAGVVAIFSQRLLAGRVPVINGDGEQTRDFVYVGDVAHANVLALQHHATGPINIATGRETSVNQLLQLLQGIAGTSLTPEHGPTKPGEQRRSVLDPGRAKRVLHWQPDLGLLEGLRRTVDYFRAP
jgi:UDP-glucose 4-epimerase